MKRVVIFGPGVGQVDVGSPFGRDYGPSCYRARQNVSVAQLHAGSLSSVANDNVLYHSLLGLASPKQVLGHLSEMPTIRPGDENAFSGYFVCPASPYCCLHQERIIKARDRAMLAT